MAAECQATGAPKHLGSQKLQQIIRLQAWTLSSALALNAPGWHMSAHCGLEPARRVPTWPFLSAEPIQNHLKPPFYQALKRGERSRRREKWAERASVPSFNLPPRGPFVRESVWSESTVCSCPLAAAAPLVRRRLLVKNTNGESSQWGPANTQPFSPPPRPSKAAIGRGHKLMSCVCADTRGRCSMERRTMSPLRLSFDRFCCRHF